MINLSTTSFFINKIMKNFWRTCSEKLEQEMTQQQFNAWIKPLAPLDCKNGRLRIAAPNHFKLDWVKIQFAKRITILASEYWHTQIKVLFVLNSHTHTIKNTISTIKVIDNTFNHYTSNIKKKLFESTFFIPRQKLSKINKTLTFENLVIGKANQLAHAAAAQIANNLGISYNPLFLYGGVGLGKTHLMHAIGNQVLADNLSSKIRYIHAEQYVRDVAIAYQRKGFNDFKNYYHSLDLLLIDDIQFFCGKNRIQEEFFYAFEALITAKRQIIITSDTYPKEIHGIDNRLISRFHSGLTVAIEPPELKMRIAILLKKAILEDVQLSDNIACFIAKNLRSNVRELEGALQKVLAYSRFHSKNLTINVVKDALKDILFIQNKQISVDNIQRTVADFFHIKITDMYSKKRPANIARPRQIAMYLAKELTQKSLPEIGNLFGGRDHTTVLHAVRKITADRAKNLECNHELHILEQTLKN